MEPQLLEPQLLVQEPQLRWPVPRQEPQQEPQMQEQQPGPSVSARGAHYPTCQTPMTKAQHEEVGGAASTRRRRGEEIGL